MCNIKEEKEKPGQLQQCYAGGHLIFFLTDPVCCYIFSKVSALDTRIKTILCKNEFAFVLLFSFYLFFGLPVNNLLK